MCKGKEMNVDQSVRKIRALMVLKNVTNVQIAKYEGVSETYVSLVINGHRRGPRIRKAIARALGMRVEDLWPSEQQNAE